VKAWEAGTEANRRAGQRTPKLLAMLVLLPSRPTSYRCCSTKDGGGCLRPQTLCLLIISHHYYVSRASAESGKMIAEFGKVTELFFRIRSKSETSKICYS